MTKFSDYMAALSADATPDTAADYLISYDDSAGTSKKVLMDVLLALASGGGGFYDAYLCYADEKTSGTNGGTATSGSWQTRTLNTERSDTASIGTLSSNEVTLPAGTYRCLISVPAVGVNVHQARLYNVTGAAVLIVGQTHNAPAASSLGVASQIQGRFTLSGTTAIRVEHRVQTTNANIGHGVAGSYGTECYTVAEFWREA